MEKKVITFPKVPVYVKEPVAPLYREWADIAEAYERHPASLRAAWLYLGHHPAFWAITEGGGSFYVASGTGWYKSIELGVNDDDTVWVEIQPCRWPDDVDDLQHFIVINEPDYKQAVLTAAATVHNEYRNDREFLKGNLNERWLG